MLFCAHSHEHKLLCLKFWLFFTMSRKTRKIWRPLCLPLASPQGSCSQPVSHFLPPSALQDCWIMNYKSILVYCGIFLVLKFAAKKNWVRCTVSLKRSRTIALGRRVPQLTCKRAISYWGQKEIERIRIHWIQISNYLLQIHNLHMVLFKLEMMQANNKLFYTEKNYTTKSNTIKLP